MTTTKTPNQNRRVVANISLSLDGRVNGVGGDFDMSWIVPHAITDVAREHMVAVTTRATTALLGRKNYEGFAGYWPPVADDEAADDRDRRFSRWLNEVDKVVVTTRLDVATWPNTTLATQAPADVVADLRTQEGGDIVVLASSSVIRDLLNADEIDQLSITLCPETVGGGARLFDDNVVQRATWALVDHTVTESGALCLRYDRTR
jgi:dihydrofolate reductase